MKADTLKLSSPWETLARKFKALFDGDDEVTVTPDFRNENRTIRIFVNNSAKAAALEKIVPSEFSLGNVVVAVAVVPGNSADTIGATLRTAFAGNPNFAGVTEIRPEGCANTVTYAEFSPEVVQFWNDDLGNPHGVTSTLFAALASECFKSDCGATFTTAVK